MEIGNLVEGADLQAGLPADDAFIRFRPHGKHLQKRGLSGAIGSNKADFFGRIDLEGNVSKDGL
ncbi:hypothetical protein D3C83_127960 [compost metagenome]